MNFETSSNIIFNGSIEVDTIKQAGDHLAERLAKCLVECAFTAADGTKSGLTGGSAV
ncbi:MAG: hypothetical protein LBL45_08255 [Treponema sp.]|nr:hypothetical protein [Treponema sp.]